jgi:hypothetical protein
MFDLDMKTLVTTPRDSTPQDSACSWIVFTATVPITTSTTKIHYDYDMSAVISILLVSGNRCQALGNKPELTKEKNRSTRNQ